MPADQEPPSYEVLAALVVSLRGELARAQERITELEDRLRATSRNSSMPQSGEGLAEPPPRSRSLRKKTGRVAAVIIYLYIGQFLSRKRTAQALAELFGIPLSPGTVAGITARAAGKLDGFLERVRENISASDIAGFDETGFRVEGRLHWAHCAPHRRIHPTDGAPPARPAGDGGDGDPAVFHRDRRP